MRQLWLRDQEYGFVCALVTEPYCPHINGVRSLHNGGWFKMMPSAQWPERVFYCRDSVTSLDFSTNKPCQLAVGMHGGAVAIYNVQIQDSSACVANSR